MKVYKDEHGQTVVDLTGHTIIVPKGSLAAIELGLPERPMRDVTVIGGTFKFEEGADGVGVHVHSNSTGLFVSGNTVK